MDEFDVIDELGRSIAMLKFMATSLCSINEVKPSRTLNEDESFGMQQLFYHIEDTLSGVKSAIEAK